MRCAKLAEANLYIANMTQQPRRIVCACADLFVRVLMFVFQMNVRVRRLSK